MTKLDVLIPLKTVSEANSHAHWRQRALRAKGQRGAAQIVVLSQIRAIPRGDVLVRLTRIAPRRLDSDNLQGALKHVRDGVADALERNDGDPSITWEYTQASGAPREYGVRIEIMGDRWR